MVKIRKFLIFSLLMTLLYYGGFPLIKLPIYAGFSCGTKLFQG